MMGSAVGVASNVDESHNVDGSMEMDVDED